MPGDHLSAPPRIAYPGNGRYDRIVYARKHVIPLSVIAIYSLD